MSGDAVEIAALEGEAVESCLADLAELLRDAVASGASVGFLGPLAVEAAEAYWRDRAAEAAAGRRLLLVAREGDRVVGSVQLAFAMQENGRHRGEVQRLVVFRSVRGRGIGTALMRELEVRAVALGRTLLVLNTRTGDPPEALYLRLGYVRVGEIPDFAQNPDGTLNTTTLMYRRLQADHG